MLKVLDLTTKQIDNEIQRLVRHFPSGSIKPLPMFTLNNTPIKIRVTPTKSIPYEVSFRFHNGVFNIHYEIPTGIMMTTRVQKPVDFAVRMDKRSPDGYVFVKKPQDPKDMLFLSARVADGFPANYRKHSNASLFVYICHIAEYLLFCFPFALRHEYRDGVEYYSLGSEFYDAAVKGMEALLNQDRLKHLLDGWDSITLDMKQLEKMKDYLKDTKFILSNYALEKFVFRFKREKDFVQLYFYEIDKDVLKITVTSEKPDARPLSFRVVLHPQVNPITEEISMDMELMIDDASEHGKEWLMEAVAKEATMPNWEWIAHSFFALNTFMLNYKDVSMDVEERECKKQSEKKHYKPNERGSVRLFRSYTLKKNWTTAVKRKQAEFRCLAWGVRGHFRHYRSGKVIFVNAYVKGKERDKYQGKDYALIPKAE